MEFIGTKDQKIYIDIDVENLFIDSCNDLQTVGLNKINISENVTIKNCKPSGIIDFYIFDSNVNKLKVYTNNINLYIHNSKIEEIKIDDCKGNILNFDTDTKKIQSFIGEIDIRISTFELINIENLNINDLKISDSFYNQIKILKTIFNRISFRKQITSNNKFLEDTAITNSLELEDVTINYDLFINDFKNINENELIYFKFYKLKINGLGLIVQGIIDKEEVRKFNLQIEDIQCNKSLMLINNNGEENGSIILNPYFIYSNESSGNIKVENYKIEECDLIGANHNLYTTFDHCKFNILRFSDFDNNGTIKITNSKEIKHLEIKNSELNNVIFRPFNYDQISISDDSFIGGMKIYGSNPISLEGSNLNDDQKHEFYRQLKQAAKNSNNRFLELEFKAKEMEYYKVKGVCDKIMYFVSWTSGHGLNWGRPFIILLAVNFVLWIPFSVMVFSNDFGEFNLYYTCYTIKVLLTKYFFTYWHLLNPISRLRDFGIQEVVLKNISWWVSAIFLFSKVINSVLIYQIVTAFRKWGGKE